MGVLAESRRPLQLRLITCFELLLCYSALFALLTSSGIGRQQQLIVLEVIAIHSTILLAGWCLIIAALWRTHAVLSTAETIILGSAAGGSLFGAYAGAIHLTAVDNATRIKFAIIAVTVDEGIKWAGYWGIAACFAILVLHLLGKRITAVLGRPTIVGAFAGSVSVCVMLGGPATVAEVVTAVAVPALCGACFARIASKLAGRVSGTVGV